MTNQQQNTASILPDNDRRNILTSLGYSGNDFSDNAVNSWFSSNQQLIPSYVQMAQRVNPNYDPTPITNLQAPGIPVTNYMSSLVQNPVLPNYTTFQPVLQQSQQGEFLTTPGMAAQPNIQAPAPISNVGMVSTQPTQVQTTTAQQTGPTAQIDQNQALSGIQNEPAPSYTAAKTTEVTAEAAQAEMRELATIQGQLSKLFADTENGQVPTWAIGAFRKANEVMAARGLSSSSIAAGAITTAYMESAINIAAADADKYFQMDMKNLDNRQQTSLANMQARQQSMLTDVAVENAARNFNASSKGQTQQFIAGLIKSIQESNASMTNSMQQFNASEQNKVMLTNMQQINSMAQFDAAEATKVAQKNQDIQLAIENFNRQQELAVKEFNANMNFERDKFNATQQFAIDQSNVQWRRSINTANTAAENAALQANVQNAYNLSTTALNNIWQQWRDEANWAWQSAENALNREYNLGVMANNRAYAESAASKQSNSDFWALLGKTGLNILAAMK